jgi:uncharacterized protein (TIGR04255 family)
MTMESGSTLEDGGRLGTWRKPPLAYVVAELRISPYYSLKEMIPQLQSALREYFPRTVEGSELVIDPSSPPAPQPVWQLISADASRGVYISTRSFSLHATAYVNFPDFLERWSRVLAAIRETGFNPFVERAGLRYVDMIIPGDDQQPKDYLIEQLRGVNPIEGAVIQSSIWGATFSVDGFVLQAHVAAPSPEGMLFAPHFNPMQLQMPSILRDAQQRMQIKKQIGYVDTDCWCPVQKVFDAGVLRDLYESLHDRVSGLFRSMLSDMAIKEWK